MLIILFHTLINQKDIVALDSRSEYSQDREDSARQYHNEKMDLESR